MASLGYEESDGCVRCSGTTVLAGASEEATESSALSFLTAQALEAKRKEEEEEQEEVFKELDVLMRTQL